MTLVCKLFFFQIVIFFQILNDRFIRTMIIHYKMILNFKEKELCLSTTIDTLYIRGTNEFA